MKHRIDKELTLTLARGLPLPLITLQGLRLPFNWTDQGIRAVTDTVERFERASELALQKHGVKQEHTYWTVGSYDLIALFEVPDEESMSAFLLELGSMGNLRSTTLRVYEREEMEGIIGRLG